MTPKQKICVVYVARYSHFLLGAPNVKVLYIQDESCMSLPVLGVEGYVNSGNEFVADYTYLLLFILILETNCWFVLCCLKPLFLLFCQVKEKQTLIEKKKSEEKAEKIKSSHDEKKKPDNKKKEHSNHKHTDSKKHEDKLKSENKNDHKNREDKKKSDPSKSKEDEESRKRRLEKEKKIQQEKERRKQEKYEQKKKEKKEQVNFRFVISCYDPFFKKSYIFSLINFSCVFNECSGTIQLNSLNELSTFKLYFAPCTAMSSLIFSKCFFIISFFIAANQDRIFQLVICYSFYFFILRIKILR